MEFKKPTNANYSACIVKLSSFVDLPNCDNVKHALIFGYHIVVSKDTSAGDMGIFFPAETALSSEFLSANNLYRKAEFGNVDPEKKGFFEQHGRVKTMKFRGHKSEGFWIPLNSLEFLGIPLSEFPVGAEFDEVNGTPICHKYIARGQRTPGSSKQAKKDTMRLADRIAENQFRFHYDTANLRRNTHKIEPNTVVSISEKWHGTSVVISNLLVNRPLKWYEKALKALGVRVQEREYGIVWSSRKVVKGVSEWTNNSNSSFYSSDIYSEVKDEVKDRIPKGFTLYGEIVGFLKDGGAIQSLKGMPYSYGCLPGHHKFLVYRVTFTNEDGRVTELSWPQMKEFCSTWGLDMVKELYYGKAVRLWAYWGDESPDRYLLPDDRDWSEEWVKFVEEKWVEGQKCDFNSKLPAEGVVVRIDHLEQAEAYKLKSFEFLKGESEDLDAGVSDIESDESVEDGEE